MASADANTVTVRIDPTATSRQADIIQAVTLDTAGVMTPALLALLLSLIPSASSTKAFVYTVLVTDGGDFTVPIPLADQQPDGDYVVSMTLGSLGQAYANPTIPIADQTGSSFRVVLDGSYDAGTLLGFIIRHT